MCDLGIMSVGPRVFTLNICCLRKWEQTCKEYITKKYFQYVQSNNMFGVLKSCHIETDLLCTPSVP